MKEDIRQRALALGFDDCRFAAATSPDHAPVLRRWLQEGQHGEMAWLERNVHKRLDPQQVLPGVKTMICLAVSYAPASPEATGTSAPKGVMARYARYQDYHDVLGERLKQLSEFLCSLGQEEVRSLWYVDTGPILERDFAQRAGLGFVGKHTNLISRKLGNWLFLSEILTTLDVPPDAPEANRCGHCTRCLTACPTQAITAPFQLDARRCISYLTIELKGSIPIEFRPLLGNRIYGCDDCLDACPWNRFARAGALMQTVARPDLATPDLLELLALDPAGFKARFTGTPMLRTKRRGLLRNVCVALGNVGDASALPALHKASQDEEPLVREHAVWAIAEIRRRLGMTEEN